MKLKYYNLMIELDMKEKKYLQVSKHFQQINTTPIVTKDESKVMFAIATIAITITYDIAILGT